MREDEVVAERVRGLLDRHSGGADPDDEPPGDDRDGADPAEDGPRAQPVRSHRPTPLLLSRLASWVPVRLDPGRRAAIAVGLAVLVAALVTGAWLLASRPRSLTLDPSAPITGAVRPQGSAAPDSEQRAEPAGDTPSADTGAGAGSAPAAAELVVDVAGKVRHPGLYDLAPDARVADAIAAAGGPRRGVDLTSVNLAAKVADGQQIVIGRSGAAASGGQAVTGGGAGPGAVPASAASGPVDLNTATLEQLESLPGIGPALGQRILDWRAAHSSFASIDQLKDVSGIGDVRFADLKPLVTV